MGKTKYIEDKSEYSLGRYGITNSDIIYYICDKLGYEESDEDRRKNMARGTNQYYDTDHDYEFCGGGKLIQVIDARIENPHEHENCDTCEICLMFNHDRVEGYFSALFSVTDTNTGTKSYHCLRTTEKIEFVDKNNDFGYDDDIKNGLYPCQIYDMLEYIFLDRCGDYDAKIEYEKRLADLGEIGDKYKHNSHIPFSEFIKSVEQSKKVEPEPIIPKKPKWNPTDKKKK